MSAFVSGEELVGAALAARERAYAPYSGFHVGAALLCADGAVFTGCNIENASYGAAICAERAAVACAVSAGEREFVTIAVAGGGRDFCMPCGICRQVLAEFSKDIIFLCANEYGEYRELAFDDLLPNRFELSPEG